MVKLKDILTPAFKKSVGMSRKLVSRCLSTDSRFCREVVASGLLTEEQMLRAAAQYLLGRSRRGETVFWMIDRYGIMRDGQVGDTWVSLLMKANGRLSECWHSTPCLFGEHLLKSPSGDKGQVPVTWGTSQSPAKHLWSEALYQASSQSGQPL